MTSHSKDLRATAMSWGTAVLILIATLSCDSNGPLSVTEVPVSIVPIMRGQMVFVDQGQGQFESRHIQVGSKVQGYYEVSSGLKEGERVVTSANFLIDSESQLKGGMGGMAGHQHGSMEKK